MSIFFDLMSTRSERLTGSDSTVNIGLCGWFGGGLEVVWRKATNLVSLLLYH